MVQSLQDGASPPHSQFFEQYRRFNDLSLNGRYIANKFSEQL